MADIGTYGASLGIDFYIVRESGGMGAPVAVTYRIDELGHAERMAVAPHGAYSQEEIAKMQTLGEATELHLRPALERAEANRKAWLRQREKNGEKPAEPPPPPLDYATQRFLAGDDGL